jgi:MFS family permease
MNAATTNTSIWLALRNPVFRNLWLTTVISGVCVAAHNAAAFSVLSNVGESAFLISLMSTLSALPFALFTLPAGAFADMVDRKKILCAVNLWQALIALGLTILGLTHYLNPYVILAQPVAKSFAVPSGTMPQERRLVLFSLHLRRSESPMDCIRKTCLIRYGFS